MSREDTYYEALRARDHRFDGKFFVGVKTTGIYCRPICPARPKRENVEFFQNHVAAERSGYRPCLRCRPESAPLSPAWIGKSAIVQRAVKKIHDREAIELDEDGFAERFGVSARHLRRIFVEEIGKTPKQLSFENRLNLSRKLITETRLPITEIAFASGFNSVRRFNDAFKARFKKSPTEIRRNPLHSGSELHLTLAYRPPFDFNGLLHFYRSHRVGNLERFDANKMHRIIELGGKVGRIAVSDEPERSRLRIEIDFPEVTAIQTILARVRALFDLDSDPVVIANQLDRDRKVRGLLAKHPGIRLPSGWDPFEVAVGTILGQLVSVERGRALVEDLINLLGRDSGRQFEGKPIKLFPSAQSIAAADLSSIKTTTVRRQTLQTFAKAVAEKEISLEPTQDIDDFMRKVQEIRGIGPWSASYIALKALRHTDAFPETDLILARVLERHPKIILDRMRPWRGYAAALFWREYAKEKV